MDNNQEPDFEAAMIPAGEPDFSAVMDAPKRGRPKNPKKPRPPINQNNLINSQSEVILTPLSQSDIKQLSSISIKDKLTTQELAFLEAYLTAPRVKGDDRMTIDKAMISAGYGQFSQTTRYLLARKIVEKYERSAPEARNIFSRIGFGPVKIAQGIAARCESESDKTALTALTLAARCAGMTESQPDRGGGVNIIINTAPAGPVSPGPGAPAAPGPVNVVISSGDEDGPRPLKPLQISR